MSPFNAFDVTAEGRSSGDGVEKRDWMSQVEGVLCVQIGLDQIVEPMIHEAETPQEASIRDRIFESQVAEDLE